MVYSVKMTGGISNLLCSTQEDHSSILQSTFRRQAEWIDNGAKHKEPNL